MISATGLNRLPENLLQRLDAVSLHVESPDIRLMKKDGSLWLEDKPITQDDLLRRAQVEQSKNSRFAVAIRADETVDYGTLMQLMDALKGAGISRFALAADKK